MNKIFLSKGDREEVAKLYKLARTTPVVGFSVKQMLDGKDWASQAYNRLREKLDELGKKYGYNPREVQINQETGEVRKIEK